MNRIQFTIALTKKMLYILVDILTVGLVIVNLHFLLLFLLLLLIIILLIFLQIMVFNTSGDRDPRVLLQPFLNRKFVNQKPIIFLSLTKISQIFFCIKFAFVLL